MNKEFKEALREIGYIYLIAMLKIVGITFTILGVIYRDIVIGIIGIVIIDLTPSFIKEVWKHLNINFQKNKRK
jgi:hypothetical protein